LKIIQSEEHFAGGKYHVWKEHPWCAKTTQHLND
jgi:hypothetical protein